MQVQYNMYTQIIVNCLTFRCILKSLGGWVGRGRRNVIGSTIGGLGGTAIDDWPVFIVSGGTNIGDAGAGIV